MTNLAHPYFLIAGITIPLLIWMYVWRLKKNKSKVIFPALNILKSTKQKSSGNWIRHTPFILKCMALLLMTIALARPQSISSGQDVWSEGIDIVLALDISASMLAQDFRPDRAQASKVVAAEFINGRPNDRIGVVLFAKYAFTQCPLTIDHAILLDLLREVEIGLVDADNTAIGSALAAGLKRLEGSQSKSKVIILLTDGENNYGLPPTTAAEAAQALGVRVYTIGVGSRGVAPYPARDVFGRVVMQQVRVSIDEELLKNIAQSTGGRYFRATDENKLREIFSEIDKMEKARIEVRAYRKHAELFYPWLMGALVAIALSFIIELSLVRRIV